MCSVIEIKNANEYYIHYHSPESMVTPAASDVSVMSSEKALKEGGGVGVDGGGQNKEANNTISNDHVVEANAETSTKLKRSSKDQEVTSDRGSSASPSLEDEEENTTTPAPTTLPQQQKSSVAPEVASEANNKSPSKIPVRSFKKLPAPQPPTTSQQNNTTSSSTSTSTPTAATNTVTPSNTKSKSGKSKGTNPFETDENEESSSKTQPQQSRPRSAAAAAAAASARSALPRPSPPKSSPSISASASVSPASAKNKLTPARSCESVPITVNSHIPASPLRPTGLTKRRVTSEMATQVEATTTTTKTSKSTSASSNNNNDNNKNKNNTAMKSASEENLANLEEKAKKPNLFKKTSESSDPICNTGSNAKWSYTNGRGKTFQRTFCR